MGRLGDVICLEVSVVAQAILIFVLLELLMAARIRLVVADVAIERRQIARWDPVGQSISEHPPQGFHSRRGWQSKILVELG